MVWVFGAPPQSPKTVKQVENSCTLKTPRKLVGGKERETDVTGKGSCYIKSFCATGDKGYMGQKAHVIQQDWGIQIVGMVFEMMSLNGRGQPKYGKQGERGGAKTVENSELNMSEKGERKNDTTRTSTKKMTPADS